MPSPAQIRAARMRLHMTQREFALALGLRGPAGWRTVQNWEADPGTPNSRTAPEYLSFALKALKSKHS